MSNIKLRAHHGLCILFFEGKGYDLNFINNMSKIINQLSNNPEVIVVNQADAICVACPNLVKNCCSNEDKVFNYDKMVLELCEISENSILSWIDFTKLIKTKIIDAGKMKLVCKNCCWKSICIK